MSRRLISYPFAAFLAAATGGAPCLAAPTHFDMDEIRVEGTTVLPQEQVEEAVYPFLGPDKTAADLEKARAALEALYQNSGFATVSVTIPPQSISASGGVFVLQAIERPVERLRIVGAKYFLPSDIRSGAKSLAPGTVPNMNQVARDLTALNGFPDRTVKPDLKAGRHPDTVDVDLDVTDTLPFHGSLELNNRYNADTTPLRLSASLSYNNLWQRGDSVNVSYNVAPEKVADAEISAASYLFHIPDSKLSLLFSYLHSNSNVTALGSTEVYGRGTTAGFRLLIPLGGNASFNHSLSIGWDYKRYFELDYFKPTQTKTYAPDTYYPLTASYSADWTADRSVTDLTLTMEFGLPSLGSNVPEFNNKSYNANPGFSILRANVTRTQNLPHDVQLWGSVSGQMTNDPLVSSEQIAMGGADSLRGYLEAEALGDYGAYMQTEARSPSLAKYLGGPLRSWRFHVFYDGGFVYLRQPSSAGVRSTYGLQSAGIGTRINLWGYLNGVLQDAQTLTDGQSTRAGTNRVLFRVYGEF